MIPCIFFFNDTATTEIYTLSLHDALPTYIFDRTMEALYEQGACDQFRMCEWGDRKSTRLNSSHDQISYAVFCLKKKKETNRPVVRDDEHKATLVSLLITTRVFLNLLDTTY